MAVSLLASLLSFVGVSAAGVSAAGADQTGPDQARLAALTAKVNAEAAHIHHLTEQLDQARLQVNSTSARLVGVIHQNQVALQGLEANRAVLTEQALRAYMRAGATPATPFSTASASGSSADLTLGREYLRVASGDVADTGDKLRQLGADLRAEQATLRGAQQANLQATVLLQSLRSSALSIAAADQAQLDSLQVQLVAQAKAAAVASLAAPVPFATASRTGATQGLPVNNGLVSVVQQAAGLPIATPVATPVTTPVTVAPPAATGSGGGGHAGGVWLQLRRCESGDNYAEDTGNGYYGAYQFSQSTWTGLGYPGRPDLASPAAQDQAAMQLQAQSGWGQWPTCAAALGLT